MNAPTFLKTSGALVVSLQHGTRVGDGSASPQGAQLRRPASTATGSNQLDSWIAIGADGTVTAYTGKCELGHGLYTAQTQLIAEELSRPVRPRQADAMRHRVTPDQGTTSGAQSHPTNFNQANLALAGATAREALLRAWPRRALACRPTSCREGRRHQREGDRDEEDQLRRAGRRTDVQPGAQSHRQAKGSARMDGARHTGAARGDSGDGDRAVRVRAQRARAGHAARARGPAARRRRDARQRR